MLRVDDFLSSVQLNDSEAMQRRRLDGALVECC